MDLEERTYSIGFSGHRKKASCRDENEACTKARELAQRDGRSVSVYDPDGQEVCYYDREGELHWA